MNSFEQIPGRGELELKDQSSQIEQAVIMMVDDEPLMLEILELYLAEEGYRNFIPVDQSTRAIDILRSEMPDVVFLDINMPEVDGFEILRAIRSHAATEHLAVIVLTSSSDSATKLKALELGATDFLEKPIDSSELALRLRNTLTVKAYQDRLAYYDGLTGLPNRTLFLDRLNWSIAHAKRTGSGLSVMDVSMDRFRNINDSLGPLAGDDILKQAAGRLTQVIREVDVVSRNRKEGFSRGLARIGGDEFSILLPGLDGDAEVMCVAERILACMEEAFVFEGSEIYSTASIGIACFPVDGDETDLLVKHASAASEFAKQQGRNNYQFYSSEITARANERMSLEADLHRALEREELQLYYQPQVDSHSGKVIGMESLIRWIHPQRGPVPPEQFISLAEENGLITTIGEWVINEACRQTRAWQLQGLEALEVSVNVSARQLRQSGLSRIVEDACTNSGLDPKYLTIELTEGVMMEDIDLTEKLLHEIKQIGAALSVDDFGTGYSSMAYLQRFPFDELKIDRSFVTDVPADGDASAIVKALIAMSHSLDLKVVAEGVETEQQRNFLRSLDCDVIQGNYFCEALSAQKFSEFVTHNRSIRPAGCG